MRLGASSGTRASPPATTQSSPPWSSIRCPCVSRSCGTHSQFHIHSHGYSCVLGTVHSMLAPVSAIMQMSSLGCWCLQVSITCLSYKQLLCNWGHMFVRLRGVKENHARGYLCAVPEQAYTDYHGMMDLTEDLIRAAAREVTGGLQVGLLHIVLFSPRNSNAQGTSQCTHD